VAIRITDPDSDPNPDPDRDTVKTALAEICTVPMLLIAIGLWTAANTKFSQGYAN